MAWDPPPLPQQQPDWLTFQVWWQQMKDGLKAQEAAQDAILLTLLEANANITEVSPITITADYTGAINPASQLPRTIVLQRFNGSEDVTTDSDWTIASITGGINADVGLNTGLVEITDVDTSGSILVSSSWITGTYPPIVKTRLIPITRTQGSPPTGGTGGSSSAGPPASTSTFASITSSSHVAISGELTVAVGSSGEVDLSASLTVTTMQAPPTGTFPVWGLWKWWDGVAWQNVGSEVISDPVCSVYAYGGYSDMSEGALSLNVSKTGLTPATDQKFQFYARNNSGTRQMDFIGSATAIPQ